MYKDLLEDAPEYVNGELVEALNGAAAYKIAKAPEIEAEITPENDTTKIVPITKAAKKSALKKDELHENELIRNEKEAANKALAKFFTVNRKGEKNINLPIIEFVGHFLQKVWDLRKHTFDGFQLKDLETQRYHNVGNDDINRLKNLLAKEYGVKVTKTELETFVFAQTFCLTIHDPIKNYFGQITKRFDKTSAQAAFEKFAAVTYDRIDANRTTFEQWRRGLYVWTGFSVAQIYHDTRVNDIALSFVSQTQGTGKTMIAGALAQPAERLGLLSEPDFDGSRETERLLSEKWILFDDECSRRRKADVSVFKKCLSRKNVDFRPLYEKKNVQFRRIASFILCGNDPEYLGEFSRREFIIPFKEQKETAEYFDNFAKTITDTDLIDALWAFAFFEFSENFSNVSNERRLLENENYTRSEQFLATTVEGELLKEYFVPANPNAIHRITSPEKYDTEKTPENEYITLNLPDIMNFLSQKVPSVRLDQRYMLNAVKNENFGKTQTCKINGVQKRGYRVRLIKV